jgi:hypothetical protein
VKRRLLILAPLPLLLALGAWGSSQAADRAAQAGAELLASLAPLLRERAVPESEEPAAADVIPTGLVAAEPATGEVASVPPALTGPNEKTPHGKAPKRGHAVQPAAPRVLFVAQDKVLRLASSGARPRGVAVPATAVRPAGLKLSGVAALGIGLTDGDVLTRAVGQPALSSGAVIQAVLSARARRAPVLEGEFWRGNERWLLRVEQPYLEQRGARQPPA